MNLCRLCGEEKSPLDFNVELNDRTSSSWSYRELIEHHTRVELKKNKLLPQSICEECRGQIDGFAEFTQKLQAVQDTLDVEDVDETRENFVQLQPIVELQPVKEQQETEDESSNDSEDFEMNRHSNRHDDSLSYEEVFSKELNATSLSQFDLHLDAPELDVPEIPSSDLAHLDATRWSDLVKDCEGCSAPLSNLIEFNSHQESHHNTKTVQVPCTLCSSSFKKIYSYLNHVLNKHLHLEHLRFCCLVCDAMFFSLVPLYQHIKNHHSTDCRRIFQCLICGHHSESLSLLKKHKKVHDCDEETEEFQKIYDSVKDSGHKLMLDVEDCFKNEDGTVDLVRQQRFPKWSDYKITCSLCSRQDLTPIDYYLHHQNEHMDWTVPGKYPPPYKFSCKDCDVENFASLVAFCSHQISKHSQDLSHRCIICSKLFWNYVALSHHLKFFHPSFRQFLCMLCGKMLDRFSIFKHHLAAVHGSGRKSPVKRRQAKTKSQKSKREKLEIVAKEESESEIDSEDSESEDELSSDDVPLKIKIREKKSRNSKKVDIPKRKPNNRHRPEKQALFGPDLNSPEKLFADEIKGTSIFQPLLHLNISVQVSLLNGEVSDELANSQLVNPLRWRDLFVCAICKVKFTNINELTDHIAINHGSRTRAFGCFNCEIEYGALYESSLINHLAERHYMEHLKFCCLVCSKMFYDLLSLVHHYKIHDGPFQILVCFICGFYAKTLDDLKEHKAYHVQMENSKPDNQMLCERVLDKFNRGAEPNTINLEVAEFERNADGTVTMDCQRRFTVDWSFAQYQCPLCFVDHANPFELFAHLRLKHPKEQEQTRKIYSCKTCVEKKEFSGMHYFINHAAEFHFESLRFTCVVCQRMFWNYLALANHYKNIHPSFTAVFCCHCGKLFHSITSGAIHYKKIMIMLTEEEKKLKREGKLETEESSHICHVCGKSCKNNYTLVKHITTHEEPDPSKMLQCHICRKLFNTKNKLAQHMVGHNNLRKWKCKTCGMSFNFKKLLQMHTRAVHENERSFACSFCEKRFFKKYDLTVHVRLHTGDFPYACPVSDCDAKYPAWSNLFKHCQSRHKLDIRSDGYKKLRASEKATTNDDYGSD